MAFFILFSLRINSLLVAMLLPFLCFGQENLYGEWFGQMLSSQGPYEFSLTIMPQVDKMEFGGKLSHKEKKGCGTIGYVQGRAIHTRNGKPKVINLIGMIFTDQSIYLEEEGNKRSIIQSEDSYNSLQFIIQWEGSQAILDGHWQEHETYRRYRKGRLVLKKQMSKA